MSAVENLVKALAQANDPQLSVMIEKARSGHYDDFLSPLPNPISQLVTDLLVLGHEAIANRAIAGEFDSTAEEAKSWTDSDEGQEILKSILND